MRQRGIEAVEMSLDDLVIGFRRLGIKVLSLLSADNKDGAAGDSRVFVKRFRRSDRIS